MPTITKEEELIIRQMLSEKPSKSELKVIKACISEVKKRKGIYSDVVKCGADLHSSTAKIAEITGMSMPMSGVLSRVLWNLARNKIERVRLLGVGITHGVWVYESYLCKHQSHSRLNGKPFPLMKGARISLFKRIHAGQLVGCGCMVKPQLPL
ncbi:hypothetical protein ACS6I8_15155 [Enterobacter kobei]|uniref:hypothetical protein n=1 Tax=Enterobacter TaxID=547 RepID=UPI0006DA86BB|nr:hypothetical protein [Enterobacter kobei]OEH06976.1 hypothetical protein AN674_0200910 [Enterobacter kobei]HCR0506195.1 hypothetical protein [Enterobacter kobei]HCR1049448.1 hypothetical protein [Enterobacter kobei]